MTYPPFHSGPCEDWRTVTPLMLVRMTRDAWRLAGHDVTVEIVGGEIVTSTKNGMPR